MVVVHRALPSIFSQYNIFSVKSQEKAFAIDHCFAKIPKKAAATNHCLTKAPLRRTI
jgi:hypothetical protein